MCGKESKFLKRKTGTREKLTKCLTKTAEASIKEAAEAQQDEKLLCIIRDAYLIAREARYHNSCQCDYTRKANRYPVLDPTKETIEQ